MTAGFRYEISWIKKKASENPKWLEEYKAAQKAEAFYCRMLGVSRQGFYKNRRICSANGGLPPMQRRKQYYEVLGLAA